MKRFDAENAVDAIIFDLSDRRGLKQEWSLIDEQVKSEIKTAWKKIIKRSIRDATRART